MGFLQIATRVSGLKIIPPEDPYRDVVRIRRNQPRKYECEVNPQPNIPSLLYSNIPIFRAADFEIRISDFYLSYGPNGQWTKVQ
jgi:hypothetical protein